MSSSAPTAARPAIGHLDGLVFPTKRDEAWRYAPHRQLAELTFGPTTIPATAPQNNLDSDLAERVPALAGPRVVIVNGVIDRERSDFTNSGDVMILSLADASVEQPQLMAARVDRNEATDAYMQLNLAYGVDGVMIRVADGVSFEAPIHVIEIASPAVGEGPNTSSTGVVIHLGAGSSATVVQSHIGVGSQFGGSNVRSTITVGSDATLDHVVIQDLPAEQVHLGAIEITQGERSTVRANSFNLGGAYGRLDYCVELAGAESLVELSGLFYGLGEQVLDQQITVIHAAKDCTSRQLYRGVLDGSSVGVFNGGIDVRPGADGTDAAQSNDNLVLSNRAEVNTQPRLEILADEVACKHGATVGQLDDTALYYMRTRGIAADEARRLLINGFADQIIDDVGIGAVSAWITRRLGHDHD